MSNQQRTIEALEAAGVRQKVKVAVGGAVVTQEFADRIGAENAGWSGAAHALELLSVYVGLFLTGPGKYALGVLRRR